MFEEAFKLLRLQKDLGSTIIVFILEVINYLYSRYKKSLADYDTVRKTHPKDRDAAMKFKECDKICKLYTTCKDVAFVHSYLPNTRQAVLGG